MRISANVRVRMIIVIGNELLYILIFMTLYPSVGIPITAFNALPALAFGWFFGAGSGLYFLLIAIPMNTFLFSLVGNSVNSRLLPNVVGAAACALVTAGIGWVRELYGRVYKQSEELLAERKLLQEEITRRIQAEERLTYDALHDPLTDLPNRRLFYNRLEHALAWSKRNPNHVCAVLYLDLDHFKSINDRLGHEAGDQILIQVARRLKSSVRDTDTVTRMGGDEFAVLLETASTRQDVIDIIHRLQANLALPYEWKNNSFACSASIGAVIGLTRYEQIERIVQDADIAMYHSKARRDGEYRIFDFDLREQPDTQHGRKEEQ